MEDATVSASALRPLVKLLTERGGLDLTRWLDRSRLPSSALHDPDRRISWASMREAWREAEALTGNDEIGLALIAQGEEGAFGMIEHGFDFSATLGEALERVARLHRLVSEVSEARVEQARLVVKPKNPRLPHCRAWAEAHLATWLLRARLQTGVALEPRAIRFRHAQPADLRAHHAFFGVEPSFGQPTDELELAPEDLQLPLKSARPELAVLIDRAAEEMIARLPTRSDFANDVRRVLATSLRDKTTPLHRLAEAFGISPRTVQRRLAEQGQSLRELYDQVRLEQAARYLEGSGAVAEIGPQLGFDAPSSFHRAFGRWTGLTPLEFRARLRSDTTPGRRS
jgi:AraC-like DNA-binding protein